MLSLLIRIFIKDSENARDKKVRTAYGSLCALYGMGLNLLLFAGKYFAGHISGSVAIIADAFNNLSDAFSSGITVLGFFMAQYVISAVEVNMVTFSREVLPSSYLYGAGLTVLFTLLVNAYMTRRLKAIDMVDSLKAVE